MNTIQTNVEGLIPKIQSLSLYAIQVGANITQLEKELSELPEVIRLNKEITELKKLKREAEMQEDSLRNEGKKILIDSEIKEITTLDWTVVSLHFTPWALVVEDWANIPDSFYKEKISRDLDKTSLKKAISEGTFSDEKVYIQKDCKFVIKTK